MILIDKPFDNIEKISQFCNQCMKEDYIAIDTEFIRTSTFFPKVCLIQIANSQSAAVIDVLAVKNLKPLLNLLLNKKITKVFHSPKQDLEIFYNLFKKLPNNIFDTQIAASFLGLDEQISYEKLVQKFENHKLDKKYQFSNWSKRPLKIEQLKYALSDVTFLRKIYSKLIYQLKKRKRLDWTFIESSKFLNINLYRQDPKSYWQKIRIDMSQGIFLEKLKLLTEWREKKCIKNDITRNLLLSDKKIIKLVCIKSFKENDLYKIGINKLTLKDKNKILEILNIEDSFLNYNTFIKNKIDKNKLKLMKTLLKNVSMKEQISASLIATISDLKKYLINEEGYYPFLNGWRYEIFGNLIKDNLNDNLNLKKIINQK